jgi:hypothetical protein
MDKDSDQRPTVKVAMTCGHEAVVYADLGRQPFCFTCKSFQGVVRHADAAEHRRSA